MTPLAIGQWCGIHVDGISLRAGEASFAIDTEEAGKDHDGVALARGWERLMLTKYELTFSYFCSDDAGQCGCARRILALCYPFILFMKCWAHQVNLMVKHLLSQSESK
jgi:hypothetical protein